MVCFVSTHLVPCSSLPSCFSPGCSSSVKPLKGITSIFFIVLWFEYWACSQEGCDEGVSYVGARSTVEAFATGLLNDFTFFGGGVCRWAVILAFDVRVEREAQEMADNLSVKIFSADIIYHLFDSFLKHREVSVLVP